MAKTFVLDTSVLLFDHDCIINFKENNIVIPITVLEELDNFKIGNDAKNFCAREVIRFLDKISELNKPDMWIPLGHGLGKMKIFNEYLCDKEIDAEKVFGYGKNDHKILNAVLSLRKSNKKDKVILVTKDINLRVKGKALGIDTQDYLTGLVKDISNISEGQIELSNLDAGVISKISQKSSIEENNILGNHKIANGYYTLKNCTSSVNVRYDKDSNTLNMVNSKYVFGINPKNTEQKFAFDALMNDNIKLVALQGVAGTGKTLLALAAALEQNKKYNQIILTRPIVPLSNRDIGFLPGDADDKIAPYMMPLWDNLKYIKSVHKDTSRKSVSIDQMQKDKKIEVTALTFIRGRSLASVFFIIDEAQNLTPHEIKTIITRAGEGTKIVFTGDIHQIDSPYLDEKSNGLSYIIDRLKGQPLFAHIRLEKGERSALSDMANKLL